MKKIWFTNRKKEKVGYEVPDDVADHFNDLWRIVHDEHWGKRPQSGMLVDTAKLVESMEEFFDFLEGDDYHEDRISDYENEIVEVALKSFYGDNVYDWINRHIE